MKQKDIIVILLMLFVFVTVWIGSNIYHNAVEFSILAGDESRIAAVDCWKHYNFEAFEQRDRKRLENRRVIQKGRISGKCFQGSNC